MSESNHMSLILGGLAHLFQDISVELSKLTQNSKITGKEIAMLVGPKYGLTVPAFQPFMRLFLKNHPLYIQSKRTGIQRKDAVIEKPQKASKTSVTSTMTKTIADVTSIIHNAPARMTLAIVPQVYQLAVYEAELED